MNEISLKNKSLHNIDPLLNTKTHTHTHTPQQPKHTNPNAHTNTHKNGNFFVRPKQDRQDCLMNHSIESNQRQEDNCCLAATQLIP